MRVNSINPTINYTRNCKPRCQKLHVDEPKTEVSFKGWKGGVKGGAIGALIALGAAVILPGAIGLLPLWTTVGAIGGHTMEEENKLENEDNKK